MGPSKLTRRSVLESASRLLSGKTSPRLVPVEELVNSLEYETQAGRVLSPELFATIAGSDRSAFDRLTFRPRMNVSTLEMDLSVPILGHEHFTPILVGPVSEQGRYHEGGELVTFEGASAARTVTIVSHFSSVPLEKIGEAAAAAAIPFWCAVYGSPKAAQQARQAVSAGASAVLVTAGAPSASAVVWSDIRSVCESTDVPVVLKGVMTASDAERAIELGCDGVVVSSHGGAGTTATAPIDALIAVRDALGNDVPVLVDGSFRRATDVLAALILGARGVLIARPVMWALAAYGATGVATLLQMLQYDLARCFAMIGAPRPSELTRTHIKIHSR